MQSRRIISSICALSIAAFATIFIVIAVSGCGEGSRPVESSSSPSLDDVTSPFASFRDVPGVTPEEISAIEALQKTHTSFDYGMTWTTEAFLDENNNVSGYAALICEWMTELFGIHFQPEVYAWNDLLHQLNAAELDFAGTLIMSDERKTIYHMTDAIAARMYKIMRLKGSPPLNEITKTRLPRYGFLADAVHSDYVAAVTTPGSYESAWVNDYTEVHQLLESGEADAFIAIGVAEASLIIHDDMYFEDFLPLIYNPVAMSTKKSELAPIISVIDKALHNGALPYLNHLYNQGYEMYKKYKFFVLLNDEEKEYLHNTVSVPLLYQYFNYPVAFYDTRHKKWDGISIDILREVEKLTGFTFEVINDNHTEMPELIEMLSDGRGHIFTDLIYTKEREPHFLWNKNKFMTDQYALLSKVNYPNVSTHEIPNKRISLIRDMAHEEMFHAWFPDALYATQYANSDEAFLALERDEVDLVMVSKSKLLWYSNYYEFSGYKANFLFNHYYDSAFAFNKDQAVLCSIVDKALSVIETNMITEQWLSKTYDFRARLQEAQRPWLIGAAILTLLVLSLITAVVIRRINTRTQKEAQAKIKEADERAQLMTEFAPLAVMLWDKNFQILDCNQEAVKIVSLLSKQEYIEKFFSLVPEYQPNGMASLELVQKVLMQSFETGYGQVEWVLNNAVTGEAIPFDVTLARVIYKGEYAMLSYGQDMRELKASTKMVMEKTSILMAILDATPDLIFFKDSDLRHTECNKALENHLNIRKSDIIGKTDAEAFKFPPDLNKYYATNDKQVLAEKQILIVEETIPAADGRVQLFETIKSPIIDNGKVVGLVGISRDITQRKAAGESLDKQNSLLSTILNSVSDPIFCIDLDSHYTECNKSFEQYFNIRKSDLIGKGNIEALGWSPEVTAQHTARDKKVFAEKQMLIDEELIPSADGTVHLFETIKSPIIHDGEITGLVGTAHDITHRKAAEEEMNRQYSLMNTVNMTAGVMLEPDTDGGFNTIKKGMEMICLSVDADRVSLWENKISDDGILHYKQVCKWMRPEYDMGDDLLEYSYEEAMPNWKNILLEGKSINGPIDTLPGYDPDFFSIYTLQSILIVPLFLKGEFWGFISFDDCHNCRFFPEADEHILRSWGLLILGAIQRSKIVGDLKYAVENAKRASTEAIKAYAEAEAANRAKSSFLASMSHEIRTPMNAISGMAELLLRRDLSSEAKAEAWDIKQATSNLISIINDILDFSKIEAGKMEIIPVKYMLLSLINDTINIIRIRLVEKPIRFFTNIDGKIPNNLIGDEVRLRQILLNLLSNAVKYTDIGHISLSIIAQKRVNGQVWLEITVADTGRGIKPEDQSKLFGNFVQIDPKKNRSVEGTGLGLAIARQLCLAMNGHITVQSEYGKGSEFKVVIPQGVDSETQFAVVEEPEKKKVLVYEGRAVYAQSLCWSLQNLGVPYVMTETLDKFTEALPSEEWYYIFSGQGLFDRIKPLMEQVVFPNGKKPPLALMVEWENEVNIPNVRFIPLPVQSLSIANVLNGKADFRSFSTQSSELIRFTYPEARLLIVDDISTNLKVAEGLLVPYHAKVDTALSGARAIELVKQHKYDLIFMDHMMPEMDGIEATAHIREWEASLEQEETSRVEIPIIALTANVVVGMKEMFIDEGFNDFLAKPIDISKLDEILNRWIPREKREKKKIMDVEQGIGIEDRYSNDNFQSYPPIPGIDIQRGISMTGGTIALYSQVISLFRKDAQERLPILHNVLQHDVPDSSALLKFVTQVHAIKSASASIGAAEISARSAEMEAAGRAADYGFIRENLPSFAEELMKLIKGIEAWENAAKGQAAPKEEDTLNGEHEQAVVTQLLHELAAALETENAGNIRRLLRELGQKPCDAKTIEALKLISDNILMTEFDSALKIVKELTDANN
jgi:PAS domain S-box-containing protein